MEQASRRFFRIATGDECWKRFPPRFLSGVHPDPAEVVGVNETQTESTTMKEFSNLAKINTCNLIQYPSGRWGFVGKVPAVLAFINKETGEAPTDEQVAKANSFGVRFSGLKTRSWATKEEAEAAAKNA
jgi:hypothetical protein